MLYLDTSVLVTLFTPERESEAVKNWVLDRGTADFGISEWVVTEFLSAISAKIRMNVISREDAAAAEKQFSQSRRDLAMLNFENRYCADAGRFLRGQETALRANDALHLAIVSGASATLCTRDRRFADAIRSIGLPVEHLD